MYILYAKWPVTTRYNRAVAGMQISLVFWKAKNISNIAKDISEETIKTITYKINGAYIGLPNRKKYTTKAYEVLKK